MYIISFYQNVSMKNGKILRIEMNNEEIREQISNISCIGFGWMMWVCLYKWFGCVPETSQSEVTNFMHTIDI